MLVASLTNHAGSLTDLTPLLPPGRAYTKSEVVTRIPPLSSNFPAFAFSTALSIAAASPKSVNASVLTRTPKGFPSSVALSKTSASAIDWCPVKKSDGIFVSS